MHRPEPSATIDDTIEALLLAHRAPDILLGEDDPAMRSMVACTLRKSGHIVLEASSGIEMIRALHRLGASMLPLGVVVTDVQMPGFSGLEVLEYIRYSGWTTPAVVMTAFGDARTHAEARDLGAACVFDKPLDVDQLAAAVDALLGRRAQERGSLEVVQRTDRW